MPALTIKNVPQDLYERLKENAARHRRSVNSEVIVCLEKVLQSFPLDAEAFLLRIENFQQALSVPPLTDEFLEQAKEEGRP